MIIDFLNLDITTLKLFDPYEESEDIIKIDISFDKNQAIMVKIEELSVLTVTDNNIILNLKDKSDIKKKFDELDSYIVHLIQERKITKRLKTKFNYRQLTSNYTGKDTNIDILNLNLNFDSNSNDFITKIYKNKLSEIQQNEMFELLKNNGRTQLVVEFKSIIFDKKEGIIHLDNIIRQMKIKKLKPKRIETLEYSFIDSDESENENDSIKLNKSNDDDCLVNTNQQNNSDNISDNEISDNETSEYRLNLQTDVDSEDNINYSDNN
jgi:hypothetical protein